MIREKVMAARKSSRPKKAKKKPSKSASEIPSEEQLPTPEAVTDEPQEALAELEQTETSDVAETLPEPIEEDGSSPSKEEVGAEFEQPTNASESPETSEIPSEESSESGEVVDFSEDEDPGLGEDVEAEEPEEDAEVSPSQRPRLNLEELSRDERERMQKLLTRRAEKALRQVRECFYDLCEEPDDEASALMDTLQKKINGLKPKPPRKCKEYKRALINARKGLAGIHPDDVVKYCHCNECYRLREDMGLLHPLRPKDLG